MGQSRKRVGADGKARYTAYYEDLRGRRRSAGTFGSKKAADKAWQRAEVRVAEGRAGDPRRGRQTVQRYVEDEWFPNHVIEHTTRQTYTYLLYRYLLPEFGPMRMIEVLPSHVREWVVRLQREGVGAPTIRYCKVIVDAIFPTALNDQVTFLHPGKGVKTPPLATRPRRIITPEQFDAFYEALPDATMRLLVDTDITTGIVTVSRVVVELNPKFHPHGGRFLVKEYPKDKEWRRFRLSAQITAKIKAHVEAGKLGPEDLIFELRLPSTPRRRRIPDALPDPATLGLTEPNEAGRRYQHGTLPGYGAGRCRCRHCKDAVAVYRARRRATGKDQPRAPRTVDTDGHIGRDWFRRNVWQPAEEKAGLGIHITPHGLRHAHASWLLAGGADLEVVKERLGHASIVTTEKYLHTLPEADDTALTALRHVRSRPRAA